MTVGLFLVLEISVSDCFLKKYDRWIIGWGRNTTVGLLGATKVLFSC